jgi:hypothetical protein
MRDTFGRLHVGYSMLAGRSHLAGSNRGTQPVQLGARERPPGALLAEPVVSNTAHGLAS